MNRIQVHANLSKFQQELAVFEQQYGMSIEDFQHQFNGGKLGDDQDFFEWDAIADMAVRLKEKLAVAHEADFV